MCTIAFAQTHRPPALQSRVDGAAQRSSGRKPLVHMGYDANTYAMEDIIGHKQAEGKTMFLVKWRGYRLKDATYEPAEHMLSESAQAKLREYCAARGLAWPLSPKDTVTLPPVALDRVEKPGDSKEREQRAVHW